MTYKSFRFSESDDEIIIKAYTGKETTVDVPEFISGKPVTAITEHAFLAEEDHYELTNAKMRKLCPNRIAEIHLPATIKKLEGAFAGCRDLKRILIPAEVVCIDEECFDQCESLERIDVDSSNRNYASRNGILYSRSGDILFKCPSKHSFGKSDILKGVEVIGAHAFWMCENLKQINIPENVKTIDACAFSCCRNLENVELHKDISFLGNAHFWACESMKTIEFYNKKQTVPTCEFSNCKSLKRIVFAGRIKSICSSAFSCCYDLCKIYLPKSISRISDDSVFLFCGYNALSDEKRQSYRFQHKRDAACEFVVEPDSKAEQYCRAHNYIITYQSQNDV